MNSERRTKNVTTTAAVNWPTSREATIANVMGTSMVMERCRTERRVSTKIVDYARDSPTKRSSYCRTLVYYIWVGPILWEHFRVCSPGPFNSRQSFVAFRTLVVRHPLPGGGGCP